MPKRTTIVGIRLRCQGCGALFVIGTDGVKAARERVITHFNGCGRPDECIPVDTKFSRPKGLTYIGENGEPVVVYDGKNWDTFWEEVKRGGTRMATVMSPKLELTEV